MIGILLVEFRNYGYKEQQEGRDRTAYDVSVFLFYTIGVTSGFIGYGLWALTGIYLCFTCNYLVATKVLE